MRLERRLHWLRIFAFLGIAVSLFLTYLYYTPQPFSSCILGDYFVCSLPTTAYARLDGIFHFLSADVGLALPAFSLPLPNTLLFLLAFALLFFISFQLPTRRPLFGLSSQHSFVLIKGIFYVLAAYSIFLTYLETYLLYTLCLFCIFLTFLIFASLILLIGMSPSQQTRGRHKKR